MYCKPDAKLATEFSIRCYRVVLGGGFEEAISPSLLQRANIDFLFRQGMIQIAQPLIVQECLTVECFNSCT